jgi:putative protein-disulfide isomerase
VWEQIQSKLPDDIEVRYILGGLAPDSDKPMPEQLRRRISMGWYRIQKQVAGVNFNHDFWIKCKPRRSTYPACRAMIAAREMDKKAEKPMLLAIQTAYYLSAKNPSDDSVLIECAESIGLDRKTFSALLDSPLIQQELLAEIKYARGLGVNSFPSIVLEKAGVISNLEYDYNDPDVFISQLSN